MQEHVRPACYPPAMPAWYPPAWHPTSALPPLPFTHIHNPNPQRQVWSAKDFSLVKTLAGHEGKVMCVDSSPRPGSHQLASVAYDRTIKLWAPDELPDLLQAGEAGAGGDAMQE